MLRIRIAVALILLCLLTMETFAATLYESAGIGDTGVSIEQLFSGEVSGLNVLPNVFPGVRFELSQPSFVTQLGGHFVANTIDGGEGSIFGAIVALEDDSDFPNSHDLSTSDVLGTTLLALPNLSGQVTGDLSLTLQPGWYAVVFGSGLFGAEGFGAAVSNGTDLGNPAYVGGQQNTIGFWRDLPSLFSNQRFFIEGRVVPEPAAVSLLGTLSCFSFSWRKRSVLK